MRKNRKKLQDITLQNKYYLSQQEQLFFEQIFLIQLFKIAKFYRMPKIHKNSFKLCPVTKVTNTFLTYFSQSRSKHLKSLLKFLPVQIKDTQHLLRCLKALNLLPRCACLFTTDAIVMYTTHRPQLCNLRHWKTAPTLQT